MNGSDFQSDFLEFLFILLLIWVVGSLAAWGFGS